MSQVHKDSGRVALCSEKGKVRQHNEDAVYVMDWTTRPGPLTLQALLVVADGMGGHQRGGWASQTAIEAVKGVINAAEPDANVEDTLRAAVAAANHAVYSGAGEVTGARPGTTLTIAAVQGMRCIVAQVGDSRLYLLRHGELKQVTQDDSWAAELVRSGQMTSEAASSWAHKNQLTKAIGTGTAVEPAVFSMALEMQDVLLGCSDGLTGMVSDNKILEVLTGSHSTAIAVEKLCAAANAAGGEDNISVVLYSHGRWRPERAKHSEPVSHAQTQEMPITAAQVTSTSPTHDLQKVLITLYVIAALLGLGLISIYLVPGVFRGKGNRTVVTVEPTTDQTGIKINIAMDSVGDSASIGIWDPTYHAFTFKVDGTYTKLEKIVITTKGGKEIGAGKPGVSLHLSPGTYQVRLKIRPDIDTDIGEFTVKEPAVMPNTGGTQ
jgi:PPM family protein phosphatase